MKFDQQRWEDKEMVEQAGTSAAASTGRLHFPARMRLFTTAPTFLASRTMKQFGIRSSLGRKVKSIFCWSSKGFLT